MDVRKCKLFVLTAETRNISKTAELTGYTQSGVSHTLKALEDEVGVKLFSRDRYGVRLTPMGADLLSYVKRFLAENERLEQFVYDLHGLEVGAITIGTFTSISSSWLPPILRRFRDMHPNIEIRIREGGADELVEWMEAMTIDLAFFSKPPVCDFDFIDLDSDPLVAVLPLDYELPAAEKSFDINQFNDQPFVLLEEGVDYDVREMFEMAGVRPKIMLSSQYDMTIMSMVENHLGFSVLPKLSFYNIHNDQLRILPLDPPFYRRLGIGVRKLETTPPVVRSFIYTVQSFFKELEQR
jgi:DNA-binding transcriptional LysR family regulator